MVEAAFMTTILKWMFAALLSAIIPAVAFDILLSDWNFDVAPPWSWVMVAIIPLAGSTLLILQAKWPAKAGRTACAILISHAAIMLAFGWWRYTIVGISIFIDLLLIAVVLPASLKKGPLGRFSGATIVWAALLFGLGFPAALANSAIVVWRAEAIAGDRPYCIQYASQTDAFAYEPARTLLDLSPLKMQQRLGTAAGMSGAWIVWQAHAVLVISDGKPSFFYWLYNEENFLDVVRSREEDTSRGYYPEPKVFCTPRQHYARQLLAWRHAPGKFDISIAGRQFSVPEEYRPRKNDDALVIDAVSPDFAAYDPGKNRLEQYKYDVRISDARSANLSSALERLISTSSAAEKIEPQFDLNRIQLYVDDGKRRASRGVVYTAYDDAGQLTRLIHCWPANVFPAPSCQLVFLRTGLALALAIEDPSEWQPIEQRLADVLASFEINRAGPTGEH
jgi:hypothetical protein